MEQQITSDVAAEAAIAPRLTVVLHPNPSRIDIALNDRLFNGEKYSFSRKQEPQGAERQLLDFCETYIVGIDSARASKNTLELEISDGVLLNEFLPQVITAIKHWGSATEPYAPTVYVDNRRWSVEPVYGENYDVMAPGRRQHPSEADIGLPYSVWASA